jgi:hypothetical protein
MMDKLIIGGVYEIVNADGSEPIYGRYEGTEEGNHVFRYGPTIMQYWKLDDDDIANSVLHLLRSPARPSDKGEKAIDWKEVAAKAYQQLLHDNPPGAKTLILKAFSDEQLNKNCGGRIEEVK